MPAFEPEAVEAMGRAYAMACSKLAPRDLKSREAIAFKIVAVEEATGEGDTHRLCELATNEAPTLRVA